MTRLFLKNKIHRQHQKHKSYKMIGAEGFVFENQGREKGKDQQRDHFLHYFQLPKRERAAVAVEPDAVGRHLKAILEQRNAPTESNNGRQAPITEKIHILELQVAVPRKGHEYI